MNQNQSSAHLGVGDQSWEPSTSSLQHFRARRPGGESDRAVFKQILYTFFLFSSNNGVGGASSSATRAVSRIKSGHYRYASPPSSGSEGISAQLLERWFLRTIYRAIKAGGGQGTGSRARSVAQGSTGSSPAPAPA